MRDRSGTLTRPYRIAELLDSIAESRLVLPEFQRDFDWSDDRVRSLLATILRRWPAGSFLFQDFSRRTFYQLRPFVGGPPVDPDLVEHVVLDGQQRLTALYHAVHGTGPYVYAIRSQTLLAPSPSIDEIEEQIRVFGRDEWRSEAKAETSGGLWIPFSALKSAADYFGWRDEVVARTDPRVRGRIAAELSDAYRRGLEAFHTYSLPAVIVENELEPAAIARIFERVNTGNLPLTAFDLMVAKTYDVGWNLRDRWQEARDAYPVLDVFYGEDGMGVIRLIALEATKSVREGDVLRLSGAQVRGRWDDAVQASATALGFLRDRCGVRIPEWLPYPGMAITLAAVALEHDLESAERLLVGWFLSRSFGLQYDSAANTVTVDEAARLTRAIRENGSLPHVPVYSSILRTATKKRRSAVWRAFLAALWLSGARDPRTGSPIEQPVPFHVLPRARVWDPDTEPDHQLVLNLALADAPLASRLNGIGMQELDASIESLSPAIARQVRASQFLAAREATSAGEFIESRLAAFGSMFAEQVGYPIEQSANPSSRGGRT